MPTKVRIKDYGDMHLLVITEHKSFNSLPEDTILDWSKFKAFADDKIKVAKMMIFVLDGVENIVGKGENAGYWHFIIFPQFFQKASFLVVVKSRDCMVKN